jgi:hypothetical protein
MSFASRYISEVEGGKGFVGGAKEAAKGTAKDFGKKFSKENIVQNMFGGDDIISAALRNKFGVKGPGKGKKDKTPSPAGEDGQGLSSEGISFLKIIAKNSMALPGMARDMNVLRQNIQKLVKLKGGKSRIDAADNFFDREDKRESDLEAQTIKGSKVTPVSSKEGEEEGGSTLLAKLIEGFFIFLFAKRLIGILKNIFSPKALLSVFKRVFVPLLIIGTLFSGITDGFKKYQETGSFSEAIVAGLGGMLSFLTFGLFGEDTLKSLFDSISNFFQPITDTISKIFTGIKDFVKGLFGNIVDVKDDAPAKADDVKPTMPDPKQFAQSMAKASGASDEKSADIGGLFGAVQSGDVKGLFGKAQELAAKYPEPPPTETSPTPLSSEGVPLDQAQRNYELNKSLTGQASQTLGVPLEAPAPPKPAPAPAPAASKPTPAPASKPQNQTELDEAKAKEKEIYKEQRRINSELRDIKKRIQDPAVSEAEKDQLTDRGVELESQYNRLEREGIKQNQLVQTLEAEAKAGSKVPSAQGTVSSSGGASSSGSVGGGGGGGGGSGGGGGGGGSSGGGGSLSAGGSAPSGSEMSQSSSQVAEGQRMESAADAGSVVNSPTTNNSTAAPDGAKPPVADAYNEDFARLLART